MNKLYAGLRKARAGTVAVLFALSLTACASTAEDIGDTGLGPHPELPAPQNSLLPTINIAPVQKRASQNTPTAPEGFTVSAFASGLEHPRWLYALPNGDLLVAESNAPAQHDERFVVPGVEVERRLRLTGKELVQAEAEVPDAEASVVRAPTVRCLVWVVPFVVEDVHAASFGSFAACAAERSCSSRRASRLSAIGVGSGFGCASFMRLLSRRRRE